MYTKKKRNEDSGSKVLIKFYPRDSIWSSTRSLIHLQLIPSSTPHLSDGTDTPGHGALGGEAAAWRAVKRVKCPRGPECRERGGAALVSDQHQHSLWRRERKVREKKRRNKEGRKGVKRKVGKIGRYVNGFACNCSFNIYIYIYIYVYLYSLSFFLCPFFPLSLPLPSSCSLSSNRSIKGGVGSVPHFKRQ